MTIGPPKSEAGKRLVSIPATLLPDLRAHMETYAEKGEHGHVFVGPKGAKLPRANFTPCLGGGAQEGDAQRIPLS
ncbi:hypothetical protein AB0H88_27305 [Nonomuraea sp. NPDC050680]|uniref:hypothetical protein n=1 Tax=Nonomuraea sp. NPDC050680 TaxID=3154630 RepID=UPI0033FFCB7F